MLKKSETTDRHQGGPGNSHQNADKPRVPVRTVLLAGAGCSYQAGIPLARGFVDDIKARFPEEYERAVEKPIRSVWANSAHRTVTI